MNFVQDDGYQRAQYWSTEGIAWLMQRTNVQRHCIGSETALAGTATGLGVK